MSKNIKTVWERVTYDVWGNAKDGWEVNDAHRTGQTVIHCAVTKNNAGTPQEFESATPNDRQIRKALGLRSFQIETDGDDCAIYVNRKRDDYPCGELRCVSHESLSPVRAKGDADATI